MRGNLALLGSPDSAQAAPVAAEARVVRTLNRGRPFGHLAIARHLLCMKARNSKPTAGRLVGWEAIADYLSLSSSTVRRYHDTLGMPVIRITGPRVWTTCEALDLWVGALARLQRNVLAEMSWHGNRTRREARRDG